MAEEKQKSIYESFGIEEETFEKSKNILPTFEIGKLNIGDKAYIQFMESLPRNIEVDNKYRKKGEPEKRQVNVISVYVEKIERTGKDEETLEIPVGEKQTLFLSSKSLSLGILRICKENNETLEGIKAKVKVGTADYKDYGENRAYNVTAL